MYSTLPAILRRLVSWNLFELDTDLSEGMLSGLSRSVVDEKQVHIHPAITVTGIRPEGLTPKEQEVYRLIAGRMLEAFLPSCRTETTFVKAVCAAQVFQTTGVRILEEGWHALFQRPGVLPVPENPDGLPMLEEGETPDVCSCNLIRKRDLPVHPFTDAELVEYMERKGLGTVASRTSIIRTLLNRNYIRYAGKYIVPTPKGMFTYETIRGKKIADTELTRDWEALLAGVETGQEEESGFLERVRDLATLLVDDIFQTYAPFGE